MRLARVAVRILVLVVGPLVAALAAFVYLADTRYIETDNAYLKAEITAISAEIDGRAARVPVKDNQRVAAGDVLFELDPRPFEIALQESEAERAAARQRIEALRAAHRQSELAVTLAEERVRYLGLAYDRQKELQTSGFAARTAFDAAEYDLATARQEVIAARQRSVAALADLGGDPEFATEAHPLYLAAQAKRDRAVLDLERTVIHAASAGYASNVALTPGEFVEVGDPVMAVVGADQMWIEANIKEVKLTHLEIGQSAEIVVDAYPGRVWRARVESISNATGSEFAILPPQNATGNWVKVVQRVPVRLTFEEPAELDRLRAGMSVRVSIDTGRDGAFASLLNRVYAVERGE